MATYEESFANTKPRRPWLRRLKWAGWGLLILLIPVVTLLILGFCFWAWRHETIQQRFDKALAQLDRSDPGWRLADIEASREEMPEDENSARVVVAVGKLLPKDWPSHEFADRFSDLMSETQIAPEDFAALTKELSDLGPALKEARKLVNLPRGRHRIVYRTPIMGTLLNDQNESRRVIALLHYESLRQDQEGDLHEALRTCRAAFNAGRSIGDEPLSISQLIRNACIVSACHDLERLLAQGEPPPEELAPVQSLLRDEDVFPDLFIVARSERAMVHEILLELDAGQYESDPRGGSSERGLNLFGWLGREQIREEHPAMLTFLSRFVAIAQLPEPERIRAERQLFAAIHQQDRARKLAILFLSSLETVNDSCLRKHAYVRCLTTAIAAECYRLRNKNWPESLGKLCPQFLAEVPLDPFDGEPLRYRCLEDGVIIYSVGQDAIDDGGNLNREHPNQPGVDVGIRLWDVAKRSQPPRPKPKDEQQPR